MSLPARSSSTNVKPPAVPMPGIDGGENAIALPSGILRSSALMWARMAPNFSSGLVRSDQGLKLTKKKALYVLTTVLWSENPITDVYVLTPGVFFRMSSTFSAASLVRWSDDAFGSCSPT